MPCSYPTADRVICNMSTKRPSPPPAGYRSDLSRPTSPPPPPAQRSTCTRCEQRFHARDLCLWRGECYCLKCFGQVLDEAAAR